jgi:dipeptidyl aminopeptidase/acylaminoacyl peptidase
MGGSYGGYATLAGLTIHADVFACGVDIVGPSNLETLLESIPPYWAPMKAMFQSRVGDPGHRGGPRLLKERSPLTHVDKIVRPLLIGQGANDPRVKQAESDQIVAAMQARHPRHLRAVSRRGPRLRPAAKQHRLHTVAASSATVPHGAEFAPGLKEALKAK